MDGHLHRPAIKPPFRGVRAGESVCSVALVQHSRRPRLVRVSLAAFAALFLVMLMSSGVRSILPELKGSTRALAPQRAGNTGKEWRLRFASVSRERGSPGAGVGVARSWRAASPPRLLPRISTNVEAPEARDPGADALGLGSVRKRHRWAVLGGHGRHGAG